MKQIRNLHLVGATGTIRTATYNEREHLVVPVVAMVEGVVWASNSDVPEFVPAEELAETPQQWNGRGCFAGHPKDGRTPITANTPRTLEQSFGIIFDAADSAQILRTRRLEFNVWIDPEKAEVVGAAAVKVVDRLRAGEMIEVSVGALVESEDKDGTFNGQQYHGVWHNIVSDHVAFLSEEEVGACSNAAGCGAPRAAVRHLIMQDAKGASHIGRAKVTDKNTLLKAKFAAVKTAESMSANAIYRAINEALRASEPGYMGIDDYFPDDGYVIYYVAPEDKWMMKRRNYTIAKDGSATLTGKAVEVEPVTTYEPVTAAKKPAAVKPQPKTADCGCKGDKHMTRAELIASLVTDKHSGFKDGDEPFLETASDARLEEFRSAAESNKARAGDIVKLETSNRNLEARIKVTDERLRVAESPLSEEEFAQRAPAGIKSILDARKAEEDGLKASLVSLLKDLGAHTEDDLKKMPIGQLQTLAAYARVEVPDFSGKAMPRLNAKQETNDDYIPPNPYEAGLKTLREHAKA